MSATEETGTLVILFVFVSLLLGSLIRHASKVWHIGVPYTVALMALGWLWGIFEFAVVGFGFGRLGDSVNVMSEIDPFLLLQVFLPALIFESSFNVDFHILTREFGQALLLAGPGVIISGILTALLPIYVFGYDWDWNLALVFGFILAATDPVAVVALLRELGASKRLATLIEAESLLNDGTSFVFFSLFLERALGTERSPGGMVVFFIQLSFGGFVLGVGAGCIAVFWLAYVYNDALVETTITITTAYLVFWWADADTPFLVSGVLATVFLGLTMSRYKAVITPEVEASVEHVWEMIAFIANTLIFILAGAIVAERMFSNGISDFGNLIVLYIFLHLIRGFVVLLLMPLMIRMGYGMTWKDGLVLTYGGLRGAVGLALALLTDLETDIDEEARGLILFHVSGIVILTLVINGSTTGYLLHKLGMDSPRAGSEFVIRQTLKHLTAETEDAVRDLKNDKQYSGADWDTMQKYLPDFKPVLIRKGSLRGSVPLPETVEMVDIEHGPVGVVRVGSYVEADYTIMTELRHRFLSAMKSSYWEQFESGMTTRQTVALLVEAVERAIDDNNMSVQWNYLEPHFHIPVWMRRLAAVPQLGWLTQRVLYGRIAMAVELSASFLVASSKIEDIVREFPEFSEATACLNVKAEVAAFRDRTKAVWIDIQKSFPKIYRSIQTKHAAEYVLHHQKQAIETLFHRGILEDKESDKMMDAVNAQINRLRTRPLVSDILSGEQILLNVSFLQGLSPAERHRLIGSSEHRFIEKGDLLYYRGEKLNGIYVITRGLVSISIDAHVMETLGEGSVVGTWAMLSNENSFADVEAITIVEAFFVPRKTLDILVRDPEIEQQVWKLGASALVKYYFADRFIDYSFLGIIRLCNDGTLVCLSQDYETTLQCVAILLRGSVEYGDGITAEAPLLLLPSLQMYRFTQQPRLLILAISSLRDDKTVGGVGSEQIFVRKKIDTYLSHYHAPKLELMKRKTIAKSFEQLPSVFPSDELRINTQESESEEEKSEPSDSAMLSASVSDSAVISTGLHRSMRRAAERIRYASPDRRQPVRVLWNEASQTLEEPHRQRLQEERRSVRFNVTASPSKSDTV